MEETKQEIVSNVDVAKTDDVIEEGEKHEESDQDDLVAIDIAIIPPTDIINSSIKVNKALLQAYQTERSLQLSQDDHLPHISLVQAYVPRASLDLLVEEVKQINKERKITNYTISACKSVLRSDHSGLSSVYYEMENSHELHDFHNALMEMTRKYLVKSSGTSQHFYRAIGEPLIMPESLKYCAEFESQHANQQYWPHITLGRCIPSVGEEIASDLALQGPYLMDATHVGVFQLGDSCTCRKPGAIWESK